MSRVPLRPALLVVSALALLCGSCQGGRPFFPVSGSVFVDGKPAEGVTIVFHAQDDSDPEPVQPSAVVQKDGSFSLRSYVVQKRTLKEGAPAGKYVVTCVWYPPNLQDYLGSEHLPDKLKGKYADPKTSELRAEVSQGPTEVPAFQLKTQEK